jgi:hypothetical protein
MRLHVHAISYLMRCVMPSCVLMCMHVIANVFMCTHVLMCDTSHSPLASQRHTRASEAIHDSGDATMSVGALVRWCGGAAFSRLTVPLKLHTQARNEVEVDGMTDCKYQV